MSGRKDSDYLLEDVLANDSSFKGRLDARTVECWHLVCNYALKGEHIDILIHTVRHEQVSLW